jgi:hypothetical protein
MYHINVFDNKRRIVTSHQIVVAMCASLLLLGKQHHLHAFSIYSRLRLSKPIRMLPRSLLFSTSTSLPPHQQLTDTMRHRLRIWDKEFEKQQKRQQELDSLRRISVTLTTADGSRIIETKAGQTPLLIAKGFLCSFALIMNLYLLLL